MQCRLLCSHKYFLLRGKKKKMTRKTEWGRTEKKSEEGGKVEGKGKKKRGHFISCHFQTRSLDLLLTGRGLFIFL